MATSLQLWWKLWKTTVQKFRWDYGWETTVKTNMVLKNIENTILDISGNFSGAYTWKSRNLKFQVLDQIMSLYVQTFQVQTSRVRTSNRPEFKRPESKRPESRRPESKLPQSMRPESELFQYACIFMVT